MKKSIFTAFLIALTVFILTAATCFGQSGGGGGKSLNSAEALYEYLNSQPANSLDKPIKVSMTINDPMLESVAEVIKYLGKYVSLNITGSALTTISESTFRDCKTLVSITIPSSVTSIKFSAFNGCTNLTSVTFQGTITEDESGSIFKFSKTVPSYGDLDNKYLAGGPGTYTTTAPMDKNSKWTKK